jgi:hypothetical protein
LEEALKRTPSRSAVEKDRDFVARRSNRGLEDEEESIARVGVIEWDQAGIKLADVKGHIWE